MVDETKEDVIIRQRNAQRIVGDAAIRAAFEQVKATYMANWARTAPAEAEKREHAYMLYKAVSDVWAILELDAKSALVRDLKAAAEPSNG